MKTLKLLTFIGLIALISVGNSNAQTSSEHHYYDADEWLGFWVTCNLVEDFITGPISVHFRTHVNKDGFVDWDRTQVKSKELVSQLTDEVFKVNYYHLSDFAPTGDDPPLTLSYTNNLVLIGKQGTRIILMQKYIIDYSVEPPNHILMWQNAHCK